MNHKLLLSVIALTLACVPACASPTTLSDADSEEENLGEARQALCFGTPGNYPPIANTVVAGRQNEITSGTYQYGNGACDGYVAKFVLLGTNAPAPTVTAHVGNEPSQTVCNNTTVTVWTWARLVGGSWSFKGTSTFNAWWNTHYQDCMEKPFVHLEGPSGNYEVVVKVQARSESSGSGLGYAYNRPITVYVQ